MLTASEQKNHVIPTDWEYTDCPEEWEDAASGALNENTTGTKKAALNSRRRPFAIRRICPLSAKCLLTISVYNTFYGKVAATCP